MTTPAPLPAIGGAAAGSGRLWPKLLPWQELHETWEPRIGPEATRLVWRTQWQRRVGLSCGMGGGSGCVLSAVLAMTRAADELAAALCAAALLAFFAACVTSVLLGRTERAAQRAANRFWGVVPDGKHVAPVPYDEVWRFDAWRRRHPERLPLG